MTPDPFYIPNDAKDGEYRLYSRNQVRFCCENSVIKNASTIFDMAGGLEFVINSSIFTFPNILPGIEVYRIYGTIDVDKFITTKISPSKWRNLWRVYGHPNEIAEPSFNWVAYRTSIHIWNEPVVEVFCTGNQGFYKVISFAGSAFPSRKLWVNGKLERDIDQGPFSGLWIPEPGDITFVKRDNKT